MNKVITSEAFDALHEFNNKSKKKKIVKENTSVTTRAVKRNPHKRLVEAYEDFDEFYDAVWQKALDDDYVEVVDDAIQGSRGTTWVRFGDDDDVFQIDESELVDAVENVFNTTKSIEDAIEVMRDIATYSMRYNESLDSLRVRMNQLMEAPMSPEDKRDTELFRSIEKKWNDAKSGDNTKVLKFTPEEKDFADRYGIELPQRIGKSKYLVSPPSVKSDVGKFAYSKHPVGQFETTKDYMSSRREYPSDLGLMTDMEDDSITMSSKNSDKVNVADYLRKREEKGRSSERDYRDAHFQDDLYFPGNKDYHSRPRFNDNRMYGNPDKKDSDYFGDTTFSHDRTYRWQDVGSRKLLRPHSDLTDVEKDRVAINRELKRRLNDLSGGRIGREHRDRQRAKDLAVAMNDFARRKHLDVPPRDEDSVYQMIHDRKEN